MTAKIFLDTNILVYAYDPAAKQKNQTAFKLLDDLVDAGIACISVQVLSEFFVTVTRKISPPLTLEEAETRIVNFSRIWPVFELNKIILYEAVRGVKEHQFSYWDSLIWATSKLNQVSIILSEDFSNEAYVEGVRFLNPLLPAFDIKSIVN